ncbi:MAG: hypothetical protein IPK01_13260 [Acidobacteria bacterium]|nr:hypothetical protein [Acidobacteriota bacterium]
MNYAVEGLTMVREARIPVITIEGNHDQNTRTMNSAGSVRSRVGGSSNCSNPNW